MAKLPIFQSESQENAFTFRQWSSDFAPSKSDRLAPDQAIYMCMLLYVWWKRMLKMPRLKESTAFVF